jgi:hypothetical protein
MKEKEMNGILRCSRYAFGPNRLHYCGPDKNKEIASYINEEATDEGLVGLLTKFETMYPYLCSIAMANGIRDQFDERVIEAYWLGNDLLKNIKKQDFYDLLVDDLKVKKKLDTKSFLLVEQKLEHGALPHHSFHVFDIWRRTGHVEREHTTNSMDECRVSWGRILSVSGPFVTVETEPIVYENGKLHLGAPIQKKLMRQLESEYDIEQLKVGDLVSIHWSVICEIITPKQIAELKKYTLHHVALANETL